MKKLFEYIKKMNLKSKILFGIWVYAMIFMTLACFLTINVKSAVPDVMILLLLYVVFTIVFLIPAIKTNNREMKENKILDINANQSNGHLGKNNITCPDNAYNTEKNSGIAFELKRKIANANRINPYVDITPYELKVGFPIVKYSGFFPRANEIIIYVVPAATFKDKEQVVGYTGKSAGASIRVAKGLTVRTGSSGGRPIRDMVRKHSVGDLIITNKRVVFIGKDDNFEFSVDKISAIKPLSKETFVIQAGRSSKNIFVDSNVVVYAAGFVNYAINCYNQGLDVIAEKKQAEDEMTTEQRELCNTIRQECMTIQIPKSREEIRNEKKWKINKILIKTTVAIWIAAIAIVIGCLIAVNYVPSNPQNNTNYSLSELLELNEHPMIYDSFEETKNFYKGIDIIQVVDSQRYNMFQDKYKSPLNDKILAYFIKDSSDRDSMGRVHFNIFDETLTDEMNIEKAVEILTNYLPNGFGKYYKQDSCYKYTQGTVDVYTYSCRLNDVGIEYHNSGHFEYSYYYYLKFIHYTDTNQWKLETGYAAYGDHDKGWIEKYAEPWNINMSAYFKD